MQPECWHGSGPYAVQVPSALCSTFQPAGAVGRFGRALAVGADVGALAGGGATTLVSLAPPVAGASGDDPGGVGVLGAAGSPQPAAMVTTNAAASL